MKDGGSIGGLVLRAKFAYALGLISNGCMQNVERVAEIRNTFAHKLDEVSFDDISIKSECDKLSLRKVKAFQGPNIDGPMTPERLNANVQLLREMTDTSTSRGRFMCAVAMMSTYLRSKATDMAHPAVCSDDWDHTAA